MLMAAPAGHRPAKVSELDVTDVASGTFDAKSTSNWSTNAKASGVWSTPEPPLPLPPPQPARSRATGISQDLGSPMDMLSGYQPAAAGDAVRRPRSGIRRRTSP